MKRLQLADLFCGAGGTSAGAIEAIEALGQKVQLTAVNHWDVAIATHTLNHPDARHFCTGLDKVNPTDLFKPGDLSILWASPECTHHSVARGGKPVNDQSRATAWCVIRWAEALRPPVILVENVPEFQSWGPIGTSGKPLKSRKGELFKAWLHALEAMGYKVDWRVLRAADYGDPTIRRRLFVQAVCGRRKIVWPTPTHSQDPGDSLFPTRPWVSAKEIIDWSLEGKSIYDRKRPLSEKTMRRIFSGLAKYGLKPFITPGHGEASSQIPRTHDVEKPTPTVSAQGHLHLAEPFIISMEHGQTIRSADPFLIEMRGTSDDQVKKSARDVNADARRSRELTEPFSTVCGNREWALCEPHILPQHAGANSRPVDQPTPTVTCDGAVALVEPFLIQYYGTGHADSVEEPLASVTVKERHALVRPEIVINGDRYLLDIRFRMLQPHELAAAQGFQKNYQFSGNKTEQVKQIGNAVPRRTARALVAAALSQRSDVTWLADMDEESQLQEAA